MQGCRRPRLPDRAPGRSVEAAVCRTGKPAHRGADLRAQVPGGGAAISPPPIRWASRWACTGTWSSRIPTGTGRRSTSTGTWPWPTESLSTVNLADNPNLKPFFDRGGKLLMYHGWLDGSSPVESFNYYKAVLQAVGPRRAIPCACSPYRAWATAPVAPAATPSTSWRSSISGWKRAGAGQDRGLEGD